MKAGLIAAIGGALAFGQEIVTPNQLAQSAEADQPAAVVNGYIVMFTPGTSRNSRALAAAQAGAQVRHNYESVGAIAVTVPNQNALNGLRNRPDVVSVTPDGIHRGQQKKPRPGDGGGSTPLVFNTQQFITAEVQRVGIPAAGSDGAGVGIALLDTGIDFAHPDLAPAPNASSTAFNAITPGASCQDDGGHGTHIAGLMAAQNNAIGILGVAPAARLYCVKVLSSGIAGTDSAVMAGLDWVMQRRNSVSPPIRVVNMSFGRPLAAGETIANSPLRPFIQALYNVGVVVVAAAGNTPSVETSQIVPAAFPEVLSVAGTITQTGIRTCFLFGLDLPSPLADTVFPLTTDGAGVTISAPGQERADVVQLGSSGCVGLEYGVMSTTLGTGGATRKLVPSLAEARGTSFSAGLVSGVVARVIDKEVVTASNNAAGVENIRTWIKNNASRRGTAPLDHPWAGSLYFYNFDGVREGIAQAPN
jgi:subtilisin family serine protease